MKTSFGTAPRVLFVSWRDIAHPKAGGAEIFTHEVLKRLVANGWQVDHVGMAFSGGKRFEKRDGVAYHRGGGLLGCISFARAFYADHGPYDLVVDQCNTHQFFTPLWLPKNQKRALFIHQLTREIWFQQMAFPLNVIGYLGEPLGLKLHRGAPVLTVSDSTREGLLNYGFRPQNIHVLPEGIDFRPPSFADLPQKNKRFTALYMGRYSKYKGVDDVVVTVGQLCAKGYEIDLQLAGKCSPPYKQKLMRLAAKYGYVPAFLGFVPNAEKNLVLGTADVLLFPSRREGWGLVVTEANAMGTPAIGYDSPGIRDSIRHGVTGLLTPAKTPTALARTLQLYYDDPVLVAQLRQNAHHWAQTFSWDRTAEVAEATLRALIGGRYAPQMKRSHIPLRHAPLPSADRVSSST